MKIAYETGFFVDVKSLFSAPLNTYIVILSAKWKDCKSHKTLCTKSFLFTKKSYLHEIAAVDLSKISWKTQRKHVN